MKTKVNQNARNVLRGHSVQDDYLAGLLATPKRLPSKFFYDDRGSRLFDVICSLDEYYPTRTEFSILRDQADAIATIAGKKVALLDLGSGTGEKGRILLHHLINPAAYVPVEISRDQLNRSVEETQFAFPELAITPLCIDYTQTLEPAAALDQAESVLAFFPGSTIGNFEPREAIAFLRRLSYLTERTMGLLIGVDLKKDKAILDAAYNDTSGVTAAFNRNILARANRDWGVGFQLDQFSHRAFYEPEEGRVVMQLESRVEQEVQIGGHSIHFRPKERITTEHSYKYTVREFQELAQEAGFSPKAVWTDENHLFSLHYLIPSIKE